MVVAISSNLYNPPDAHVAREEYKALVGRIS
jgi:hypothetical protein